jgi:O-antigen/teichoic acid export membrane protein
MKANLFPRMMNANSLFRATGGVLFGMVIAQAIPLLGSLVIARLYAPAEFGAFSTWLGLLMTAAVLVTGRLEMALVVEEDGEPRRFAVAAALATICGIAGILFVPMLVLYFTVVDIKRFTPGFVLVFLPATLLMAALQTWQSWAAAEGRYRALSWIRITQALGITGIQVLAGLLAPSALALAIGHTIGLLVGIVVAWHMMPIPIRVFRPWAAFKAKLWEFWKRHRRFPMFALPADFINTAAGQLPLFFITSKFGSESGGIYALAVRILGGPISLLGTAVLDVFKRTAATSYRELGHCRGEYLRTFRILAVLGIGLGTGITLFAESFFAWAFGENWRQAGVVAGWLMPMFALRFVASPLSYVFYIMGGQRIDLMWQCGLLGMTVLAFTLSGDFSSALKMYAWGYAAMYVIYLLLSYRYSRGGRA